MAISFRLCNALFDATESDNKVQLDSLIQCGINVNLIRTCNGSTPLHTVARQDNFEFAQMLLDAGADIHTTDQGGSTPLHVAAGSGAVEVARLLVAAGADVNAINDNGERPLHIMLTFCLYERMNLPSIWLDNIHTNNGESRLNRELFRMPEPDIIWVKLARLLLDAGSDIYATNDYGETLLHIAVTTRNIDVVHYLIEAGADINATNDNGITPFHGSMGCGDIEIARLLLDAGANIHIVDVDGNTPLHTVAEGFDWQSARLLIDAGSVINVTNNDGYTPFHRAVIFGEIKVVRVLIEAGADINAISKIGERPLHIAFDTSDIEVLRILFDAGVDINATITKGAIPFHVVARNSHFILKQRDWERHFDTNESRNALYLKYIVKLKCLGLHVSEENMTYLREWFDEELRMFERECETEVAGMKRQEIREGYRFSLCDILTKREDVLRKLLHVEEVRLKLEEVIRGLSYPVYGKMVSMKFERIVKTIEFSVKARPIIGFIVNSFRSIPDECVKMIASYFTVNDMKDLVYTFK